MIWRRRCLVLVPVLSFLAAALIMSCGGGGSSTSNPQSNFLSIIGLNVCEGAPPTPTPKPSPGTTPTPTPTPICTPIAMSTTVGTTPPGNTVQFNAQGIFGFTINTKTPKYRDVSNHSSTLWNPIAPTGSFPGVISYQGNGLFVGVTTGCTYFTVSDAGFSQTVLVGVNTDPSTCPPLPAIPATRPAPSGP